MAKVKGYSPSDERAWELYEPRRSEEFEPLTSDELKVKITGEKKEKEKVKTVGFLELFRFSDGLDKFLMVLGLLFATVNGAGLPLWVIVFGEMIETFAATGAFMEYLNTIPDFMQDNNKSVVFYITNPDKFNCSEIYDYYGRNMSCFAGNAQENILDEMTRFAKYYCLLGGIILTMAYGQVACWMTAAERQAHRIRHACLFNVLRQDIGWFDTHAATELNTRLADDVTKIQEGLGDKVATFWQWFTCSIFSLIGGFIYGWKLTLVVLTVSPAVVITAALFGKLASTISSKSLEAYAQAGSVAEEVFASIRTVMAFGGQEKEAER